jgi:hypothetical protein
MHSKSGAWSIVLLTSIALLAIPAAAGGAIDYSKNAATGDYSPVDTPPVQVVRITDGGGFGWGDAGIGAATMFVLVLVVLGAAMAVRRRHIVSQ